jgi:hypothetical protein
MPRFALALAPALAAAAPAAYFALAAQPGPAPMPRAVTPLRLVSAADHARRLALLPATADGRLARLAADPRFAFYDRASVPPAYEDRHTGIPAVYNINHNESAAQHDVGPRREPFGNPNREFPWDKTAGVKTGGGVYHFVVLIAPVRVVERVLPNNIPTLADWQPSATWVYPEGTTFGEILTVTRADGREFACEVRTRTKVAGKWQPDVYRPFSTAADLGATVAAIGAVRASESEKKACQEFTAAMNAAPVWHPYTLGDFKHDVRAVDDIKGAVETLPPLPEGVVTEILSRPFVSVKGVEWREVPDRECHAPTSKDAFHVVQKDYDGAFFAVSQQACMRCHDTVQARADLFQSPATRDWYGRVRGSDGIFSLHPFEPSSYGSTGNTTRAYNKRMVDAGWFIPPTGGHVGHLEPVVRILR